MPEIKLNNGKTYGLKYSFWSIYKAEEASGLKIADWSGSFKAMAATVYAGIVSENESLTFDELLRLMPSKSSDIKTINEVCSSTIAKELEFEVSE